MNRKVILSILLVLSLITLGCGLVGGTTEPTATTAPTKTPEPTKPPEPTKTPEPTKPAVELGEEYRSEEGGYSFRTIPGFEVEEGFGIAGMEAPDADPEIGPAIMMIGYVDEEGATPEELFEGQTEDLEEGVEISPPRPVTVDGKPGLMADISGTFEGEEVSGLIVVVAVTANHRFIMIAAAPADQWDAFAPQVDAVLASIRFFPPTGIEPPPTGGEIRQWAIYAEASSQYSDPNWSAMQATGAPDTPECGDEETAWASEGYDTVEWIELDYDTPVLPTEVNIFQTYNPNQVVMVELRDLEGEYHVVYEGEPEDMGDICPFVLHIPVEGADRQVDGVRITIDQSVLGSWNEIDAVELVGIAERPGE